MPEYGLAPQQYEALASALRDQGHDARVVRVGGGIEERGGLGPPIPGEVIDVAIYLGDHVASGTIGAIVAVVLDRLRRQTKRTRRGVIYGPGGEELRRFELPPED